MTLDPVLQRFMEHSPVAVMARVALERAINAEWIDEVFDQNRRRQYTHELLFSTIVDLMAVVAVGLRPSLHAAAKSSKDLKVSMAALYEKVNHVEPAVLQALVHGSGERLGPIVATLRGGRAPCAPGYRVRILDGNHLAASEKRLAPLRGFRGAALPGQSLVVFDPDLGLVVDLEPCEDAHSQERVMLPAVLERAQPSELWIGDRNFSTRGAILTILRRGGSFVFREHGGSPCPTPMGERRKVCRVETGVVYEQPVTIPAEDGETLTLRRVEIELDHPTEDGDTLIRILTNLPEAAFDAGAVARLYRGRWTIEGMFQRLESVLYSEVHTLGYPRAALFAFATAILTYNALALIQAAIEAEHDLPKAGLALSSYFIAGEVKAYYAGMMVAVPPAAWAALVTMPPVELGHELRRIAAYVDPKTLRKHPRKPKSKVKKGYAARSSVERHAATARVLIEGWVR